MQCFNLSQGGIRATREANPLFANESLLIHLFRVASTDLKLCCSLGILRPATFENRPSHTSSMCGINLVNITISPG